MRLKLNVWARRLKDEKLEGIERLLCVCSVFCLKNITAKLVKTVVFLERIFLVKNPKYNKSFKM